MAGHVVVSGSLVAQVEVLIARVGRQRLLELFMGAHAWDVRREPTGLTLTVDGVPLGGANGPSEGSASHQFSNPADS